MCFILYRASGFRQYVCMLVTPGMLVGGSRSPTAAHSVFPCVLCCLIFGPMDKHEILTRTLRDKVLSRSLILLFFTKTRIEVYNLLQ